MQSDLGFFISIEGGEGTGKSTLSLRLYDYLTNEEKRFVVKSFEPGGTPFGQEIRKILLHKEENLSPRSELFLFLADRAQHVDTLIRPALAQDMVVITDRFTDSSIAYQGKGRNLCNKALLETVCAFSADDLSPDLTFFLDLDPEKGLGRIVREKDRLEKEHIEFHRRVREGYLELAKENPDRIFIIDASQSKDEVYHQALQKMKTEMKKKNLIC